MEGRRGEGASVVEILSSAIYEQGQSNDTRVKVGKYREDRRELDRMVRGRIEFTDED